MKLTIRSEAFPSPNGFLDIAIFSYSVGSLRRVCVDWTMSDAFVPTNFAVPDEIASGLSVVSP